MMKSSHIFASVPVQRKMTADEVMREVKRRKEAERIAILKAVEEKAERDKKRLREVLSEDAIFSITYVPYVIAEVAWDYADTILDMAAYMKLSSTKKLCRAIKDLRREYDRTRYKIINDDWRKSETENMIMFQETLSDFFSKVYVTYRDTLKQTYTDLEENSLMLVASVYECRTVLQGLSMYAAAQEKIVSSILGYQIASILPEELRKLNTLIVEFAGDSPMPDSISEVQIKFAKELAEYINDTELNDETQSTPNTKKQKMTMEQLTNLVAEINNKTAEFQNNAALNLNGNKAAGVRARKASLELEKMLKEYRKNSVK